LNAIVTLRFPDPTTPKSEREEVRTYSDVICVTIQPATNFLVIQTQNGDFTFDPNIWQTFVVSKDAEDTP
jgi:hypothetical protein